MAETRQTPGRPWRVRLGNPLSWSLADRCLTASIIVTVASAIFVASLYLGDGWPFVAFDLEHAPLVPVVSLVHLTPWLVLLGLSLRARRRTRGRPGEPARGAGLAVATVLLFAETLALFTLVTGPFASPGWIGFLGGAVVGYLMFDRRLARAGVVLYVSLVTVGALLEKARPWRWIDDVLPGHDYPRWSTSAIVGHAIASTALLALVLTLIAFVIDRWRDREARYQHLARTDHLTALTNRRTFLELAGRELARARRYDEAIAIVIVDLDHFKRVNDQHGHLVGDRVLARAAEIFAATVRDVDVVARYGGEEFGILLPATDAAGAHEVAERCRRRLATTAIELDTGGAPVHITASLGVASARGASAQLEDLLRRADQALYRAKAAGRDCTAVDGDQPGAGADDAAAAAPATT